MISAPVPQPLKEQSSISVTGGLQAAAPRLPQRERTLQVYGSSGAILPLPLHADVNVGCAQGVMQNQTQRGSSRSTAHTSCQLGGPFIRYRCYSLWITQQSLFWIAANGQHLLSALLSGDAGCTGRGRSNLAYSHIWTPLDGSSSTIARTTRPAAHPTQPY